MQHRDRLQLRTRRAPLVPPIEAFPPAGGNNWDRAIFWLSVIAILLMVLVL